MERMVSASIPPMGHPWRQVSASSGFIPNSSPVALRGGGVQRQASLSAAAVSSTSLQSIASPTAATRGSVTAFGTTSLRSIASPTGVATMGSISSTVGMATMGSISSPTGMATMGSISSPTGMATMGSMSSPTGTSPLLAQLRSVEAMVEQLAATGKKVDVESGYPSPQLCRGRTMRRPSSPPMSLAGSILSPTGSGQSHRLTRNAWATNGEERTSPTPPVPPAATKEKCRSPSLPVRDAGRQQSPTHFGQSVSVMGPARAASPTVSPKQAIGSRFLAQHASIAQIDVKRSPSGSLTSVTDKVPTPVISARRESGTEKMFTTVTTCAMPPGTGVPPTRASQRSLSIHSQDGTFLGLGGTGSPLARASREEESFSIQSQDDCGGTGRPPPRASQRSLSVQSQDAGSPVARAAQRSFSIQSQDDLGRTGVLPPRASQRSLSVQSQDGISVGRVSKRPSQIRVATTTERAQRTTAERAQRQKVFEPEWDKASGNSPDRSLSPKKSAGVLLELAKDSLRDSANDEEEEDDDDDGVDDDDVNAPAMPASRDTKRRLSYEAGNRRLSVNSAALFNDAFSKTADAKNAMHPKRAHAGFEVLLRAKAVLSDQGLSDQSGARLVKELFLDSMPESFVKVESITQLIHPALLRRFLKTVASGQTHSVEATFHGARADHIEGIMKTGLSPEMCVIGANGNGAYVGCHAGVAHQYASPDDKGLHHMCLVLVVVGDSVIKGQAGESHAVTSMDRLKNPTQYCFVEEERLLATHAIQYRVKGDGRKRVGGGWDDPFARKLNNAIVRAGKRERKRGLR